VQELLFNVVKHGETQSAEVSLSEQDGFLTVRVSDDGAGFDPESLDSALGSPGLGLLSLRERIRSIGGTLDIRSAPGEGSRIVLSVPRTLGPGTATDVDRPTDEPAVSDSSGRRPTRAGHELRVLVADDHHVMRQGLVSLVAEQPSIEVVGEASNGVEAVEMAKQLAPDVIVMDVSMPEMDGVEATRRVKRLFPKTRVIALTMYDDEQIEREMRSAGAEEFVNKAHSSANLLKAIYGLSDGE
jgi:CheY-like chemotaxis protein